MRVKLSLEAQNLRQNCVDHWEINDPAGLATVDELASCWDRLQAAKKLLAKQGQTAVDRFGQVKVAPASLVVRDEVTNFIRLQKALSLEVDAVSSSHQGRPDGFVPEVLYGGK